VKETRQTLEQRTRALRLRLLSDMAKLTVDSSDEDVRRLDRRWWYVRKRLADEATEPGEAARVYQEMVRTQELKKFFAFRSSYRARDICRKRWLNHRYYQRVLKDARSTAEARAGLAEARRRQRASKNFR
jgi:hypothetical protein